MSIDRVRKYFTTLGIEGRIQEFNVSSATVELAAIALNCEGKRIAKSLSFMGNGGEAIMVVCAGDAKVDNSKFKSQFNHRSRMLTPDEAVELIGHAVGGVCPFAVNEGVKIYLDISLKRFETVFPACGSSNSAIELTIPELEKYSNYISWVDVCKSWQD
jgi:prolyl-tRNA editing enzyme YbaK/EbsC (Cys-tRNA(Pro) deacylase)